MLDIGDYDVLVTYTGDREVYGRVVGTVTTDDVHALIHRFESGKAGRSTQRIFDVREVVFMDRDAARDAVGTWVPSDKPPRKVAYVTHDSLFHEIAESLSTLRPNEQFAAFSDYGEAEAFVRGE